MKVMSLVLSRTRARRRQAHKSVKVQYATLPVHRGSETAPDENCLPIAQLNGISCASHRIGRHS
jgi:hypothetical protein